MFVLSLFFCLFVNFPIPCFANWKNSGILGSLHWSVIWNQGAINCKNFLILYAKDVTKYFHYWVRVPWTKKGLEALSWMLIVLSIYLIKLCEHNALSALQNCFNFFGLCYETGLKPVLFLLNNKLACLKQARPVPKQSFSVQITI